MSVLYLLNSLLNGLFLLLCRTHTFFSFSISLFLSLSFFSNRYAWSSNSKMPTIISEWFSILKLLFVCDLILFCSLCFLLHNKVHKNFWTISFSDPAFDLTIFFLFLLLLHYNVKFIVPLLWGCIFFQLKNSLKVFLCNLALQWFYWIIIEQEE